MAMVNVSHPMAKNMNCFDHFDVNNILSTKLFSKDYPLSNLLILEACGPRIGPG